jgi:hypothetical protein
MDNKWHDDRLLMFQWRKIGCWCFSDGRKENISGNDIGFQLGKIYEVCYSSGADV